MAFFGRCIDVKKMYSLQLFPLISDCLAKRWASLITDKILKKFSLDKATRKDVKGRFLRAICKLSKALRDQYCDSLTGKDDKDKNKDDDKREKEKEDEKKEDGEK